MLDELVYCDPCFENGRSGVLATHSTGGRNLSSPEAILVLAMRYPLLGLQPELNLCRGCCKAFPAALAHEDRARRSILGAVCGQFSAIYRRLTGQA